MTLKEADKHTVGKERNKLFNYIRKKVSSEAEAEDILQDVFFQFYNNDRSETIERVSSWLYHVAENKIIDWYRKRKLVSVEGLKSKTDNDCDEERQTLNLEDILFDPSENPDELYIRSKVWPLLADVLGELPEEQKEVFILNELEDRSFKEISLSTNVPVNTLISRKRYAVLYLRNRLKDLYEEFF
jgi:RNA polymerase sigma factor (sigma-70 family)